MGVEEARVEYEEDTMEGTLSAALDAAEEAIEEEVVEDEPTTDAGAELEEPSTEDTPEPAAIDEAGSEAPSPEADTKETDAPVDEAPNSLPPAAREAWKDVPDVVKSAVAKREKDFEAGIMKYAEGAKRAHGMDQMLQPYQSFTQMNGGPGQTIKALLDTGSVLQMGTPTQKANTVANLINTFGIDIQALDGILSGQGIPQQTQQNNDVQQAVQQAVAPYQQMMEQQKAQQAQAQQNQQTQIGNELQQFAAANEFYKDVQGDMADILDMASARNMNLPLEEAYRRACLLNPEISGIIAARNSGAQVQKKRKAAVSISGNPGGTPGAKMPDTIEEALHAAWDAQDRV
jgi:hypothetical protein